MSSPDTLLRQQVHLLYSDHHSWLLAWLRRRLGCGHHAADVAQDTFLRVLGLAALPDTLREPRAYLVTTAKRLLVDESRRRQVEEAYLVALAVVGEEGSRSAEQIVQAIESLMRIEAALQALSANVQQAFVLHFLEGLPHAAVAAQLGVSVRMVQKYLAQALVRCHLAVDG